jgi:hypothetical protein
MAYHLIEKGQFGTAASTEPKITVTKDAFFINKAARVAFNIDKYDYVELYADKNGKCIGLKLLAEPTVNARKMRSGDGSLTISVQSAIKMLRIRAHRYDLAHNPAKVMLEFDYEEQVEESEEAEQEEAARRRGRPRKAA